MMQPSSVHNALYLAQILYMPKSCTCRLVHAENIFISMAIEKARANLQVDEDMDYP